jgi:hypothetical protein
MNKIQKLNQIEYADHYSVFDKNGNKICDSATLEDALLMCSFDSTRTYKQVKILLDQVVNIPSMRMEDDKQLQAQNILPDRMADPFVV